MIVAVAEIGPAPLPRVAPHPQVSNSIHSRIERFAASSCEEIAMVLVNHFVPPSDTPGGRFLERNPPARFCPEISSPRPVAQILQSPAARWSSRYLKARTAASTAGSEQTPHGAAPSPPDA